MTRHYAEPSINIVRPKNTTTFEIFLKRNEKYYFNNILTCSMKLFK